jgi:hypothetical protein
MLMVMIGSWRRKKSFPIRFLSYIPEYIFWFCVWFLLFDVFDLYEIQTNILKDYGITNNGSWYKLSKEEVDHVNFVLWLWRFIPPMFIFIAYEISHFFKKRYLKKKGLWEAFLRGELDGSSKTQTAQIDNKQDIGYWYELLQKGAITKEEYNKKKEELL